MPRPMSRAKFARPGQCQSCWIRFAADTRVIRTRGATTICEEHAWFIVAEAITWRGRWDARPPVVAA